MRIVPNLSEITECPNCGSVRLYTMEDHRALNTYLICADCHEKIQKGNIAINNPMISLPPEDAKAHTIKIDNEATARRKRKEKEKFLFELREEINNLKWHAHTVEDALLMERISFIFTKIADYIEEH